MCSESSSTIVPPEVTYTHQFLRREVTGFVNGSLPCPGPTPSPGKGFLGVPWFLWATGSPPATSQSLGEILSPERIMGDREEDRCEHASMRPHQVFPAPTTGRLVPDELTPASREVNLCAHSPNIPKPPALYQLTVRSWENAEDTMKRETEKKKSLKRMSLALISHQGR